MDKFEEALNSIIVVDEPVGVLVSGGADSALLLYLLLSRYKSKVHVFFTSPGPRKEVDTKHSIDIVRTCMTLTSNYNVEHHIMYTESWAGHALFTLPHQYLDEGRVRWIFSGITKNPPNSVQSQWDAKQPEIALNGRDPDEYRDPFVHDGKVYPWTNLDKQDIAHLYQRFDLLDKIFPLTRSCINVDVGDVHCGTCWWCNERYWGFGRLV